MSLEQNISQDLKKSDIYLFEKTYIFKKCPKEVLRTKLRGLYRKPGTNSSTKTGDFKLCREARDYNLTKWALSLDNNADLLWVWL